MTPEEALEVIKQGEGQRVEFKASFAEQNKAVEALCAFTHSDGGTVLFGVAPDGNVVGAGLGRNTLENFAQVLKTDTQPPLYPSVYKIHVDGKEIVAATIEKSAPGELVYAFRRPYIRVGRTNQVMSPDEQRQRLLAGQEPRTEKHGRPRFHVQITGVTRLEREFSLSFRIFQAFGGRVSGIEWRFRGPRFHTDWKHEGIFTLPLTSFVEHFDLSQPPDEDDLLSGNELGLEIRFSWQGGTLSEVHRWPVSRRELPHKILWDVGPELPTLELGKGGVEVNPLPPSTDNHVQLLVRNNGETQDFVVDVLEFANSEGPQERYKLKWREDTTGSPSRRIYKGSDDVLDVAQITPPEFAPYGLAGAHRRGSFRFFSVKVSAGWEVHAGPSGWIPMEDALDPIDPYDETIALKLRVSGSLGKQVTRRVTLGFTRQPLQDGTGATVVVDDWPDSSHPL